MTAFLRGMRLNGSSVYVSLGELKVSSLEGQVLTAPALGSCIAVCLYDPVARIGGMCHVVLPNSAEARDIRPGRYADTAVPALLAMMERRGAVRKRLRCAMAGGANVFVSLQHPKLLAVGDRNAQAVRSTLRGLSLWPRADDTGGTKPRTVQLDVSTGQVSVSQPGEPARLLVTLG